MEFALQSIHHRDRRQRSAWQPDAIDVASVRVRSLYDLINGAEWQSMQTAMLGWIDAVNGRHFNAIRADVISHLLV